MKIFSGKNRRIKENNVGLICYALVWVNFPNRSKAEKCILQGITKTG